MMKKILKPLVFNPRKEDIYERRNIDESSFANMHNILNSKNTDSSEIMKKKRKIVHKLKE